jgi:beta-lactamase superfamily II metal-dependent hydrolase
VATIKPSSVRIRAYNVGFGDCILVSFDYRDEHRHVLFDCGSTKMPTRNGPKDLLRVAQQIEKDCDGKLHMVVATHRHTDHISGFAGASGKVLAALDPDLVVQPWTEQPDLQTDATSLPPPRQAKRRAVATLDNMHTVANYFAAAANRMPNANVSKSVTGQLGFLGETNIKNHAAVVALQSLGRRHVYVEFGSTIPSSRVLPGVKIDVLGPPSLTQSAAIAHQTSSDPDEFWHLAASSARALTTPDPRPIFPRAPKTKRAPQEARWLIPQLDRMDAEEQLALVRILDAAMNNTSVILLLDIKGTRLLFPGDAQIESWRYALHDAPNAKQIRSRLASTRVYKVGHHGSLNATPKKLLWAGLKNKSATATPKRLITVMSTLHGKHGSDTRGTEVPRSTLVDELEKHSTLYTTQRESTARAFWRDVEIPL